MTKPTARECFIGIVFVLIGLITGALITKNQISGEVLLGIVGMGIAVVGTYIGHCSATQIYENQKRDYEERLKNDFLVKIRMLMAEPAIEEFKGPFISVEATDKLVGDLKRFHYEFKLLLYGYGKYQENANHFRSLLLELGKFIYRVICHRGGEFDYYEVDGIDTAEEIVLNKLITNYTRSGENESSEVIELFEVFNSTVNDLPNTLK